MEFSPFLRLIITYVLFLKWQIKMLSAKKDQLVLSFNAAFSERVLGESQSEHILFTCYDIFDVDILPTNMVI